MPANLPPGSHGLDAHVNLIPYNPIATAPQLRTTERPERDAFAAILREAGFVTTIRYSLGADIAAACGQLVQRENRQAARQWEIAGKPISISSSADGSGTTGPRSTSQASI